MGSNTALFKVLSVKLSHEGNTVETFYLIEEGSSVSMIDVKLAEELGLEGRSEPLTIRWANGRRVKFPSGDLIVNCTYWTVYAP